MGRILMWVKGHSEIVGSEVGQEGHGWVEAWLSQPEIATPAGIRYTSPLFTRLAHLKWDRETLRGLAYVTTGRRPLKHWLWSIGRAEDSKCGCRGSQNAVHRVAIPTSGERKREDVGTGRAGPRVVPRGSEVPETVVS